MDLSCRRSPVRRVHHSNPFIVGETTHDSFYLVRHFLHRNYCPRVRKKSHEQYIERNLLSVFRIVVIEASPPVKTTVESEDRNQGASLTFHNHFHIVHKTVNALQDMRLHHPGLVLRESIQSTQYVFDLAVSQQLLCELFC